jgi:hypothetical protein
MMPNYTVKDSQTGKTITFAWNGTKPPTQADMKEVFAAARSQSSPQPTSTQGGKFRGAGSSGSWEEDALPGLVGGISGGLAAARKSTLPGIALSALGGAGAEGFHQVYQHIISDPNAPDTATEALKRMGKVALEQGIGEGVGRGIFGAASKIAAPFRKNVIPEAQKVNDTFKGIMAARAESDAAFQGVKPIGFTPAQRSTSRVVDTLEEMAEKSFTGGERIRRYKELETESFKKLSDDLIADFSTHLTKDATPEEVGLVFQNAYAARDSVYRRLARIKYGRVDRIMKEEIGKITPTAPKQNTEIFTDSSHIGNKIFRPEEIPYGKVDLRPLKREAVNLTKTAEKRKGIGSTTAKDSLLEKVLKLDDSVTFNEAQAIRSGLMDEIATMSSSADIGRGMARNFSKMVDSAMEESAKNLSPDAYKAWREANTFYRGYKQKFNNDFMASLVKVAEKAPEKVIDKIFQNGAVTQIRNVKDLVPAKTFETLKASYVQKIMQESINGGDFVVGKTLKHKLKAMGQPALKEIFSQQELQRIYNVAKIGETVQRPTGGGGGMLVQLMQGSGAVGLVTGLTTGRNDVAASSGIVLIAPNVLARMVLSPAGSRYLMQGFRIPARSKEAATISSKILSSVARYNMEEAERQSRE